MAPESQIQQVKAKKSELKGALIWSAWYSRECASDKFSLIQWFIYDHLNPPRAKRKNSNVRRKNQLTLKKGLQNDTFWALVDRKMSPSKKFQRVGQVLSLPNLKSQKNFFVPRTPAGWELILSENLVGGVKTPWDPCSPQEGLERSAPLPGDFRVIVGPIPAQMDDFCNLLGTPYPPVSRIVTVKEQFCGDQKVP